MTTLGTAGQTRRGPGRITVMTYNVENMFDVFDDPYTEDETTPVKSRAELQQIATLIERMDPDVVAFQEVENDGMIAAMVNEMLPDASYGYVAVMATNSRRGINMGLMSRLPILSMTSHRFTKLTLKGDSRVWRFARDLHRVRLQAAPNKTLDLYIVHFKSQHDQPDDAKSRRWRLAEALGARRIIDEALRRDPADWTLLVGDLNDTPGSKTLAALLEPGGADRDRPPPLVDLHAHLPATKRTTYLRRPFRSTVDYILASPSLAARLVPGSARVVTKPSSLGGSDHAPVVTAFDITGPPR